MEMAKMLTGLWAHDSSEARQNRARCRKIDELLEKLQQKQERLERKLAHEHRNTSRRQLKLAIAVIGLQRKKGLARRMELLGNTE